jgi:outer membrane protein TolC
MRRSLARAAVCALGLAGASVGGATAEPGTPAEEPSVLRLEEVLRSVDDHYPLLRAAEAEREIVEAQLLEARGGFDTRLLAEGDLVPLGYYERYGGGAGIEQPTTLWGARLYGEYTIGRGDYPSYYGRSKTNGSGGVRAGIELPLLRGGAIDERRAALRTSEIEARRADPEIVLQRIDFLRDASVAYWRWVAAGRAVAVSRHLLEVATARQDQIEGRVRRGLLPEVDAIDNQRLIVDRRIRLRGAERDVEQTAIVLSLYLRDADGDPDIPGSTRLPADFPPEEVPSRERLAADLAYAASDHPALQSFALQRSRAEVDLDLARNTLLPEVDLTVEGRQDFGTPAPGIDSTGRLAADPKGETQVRALVEFELPVQRRKARGRVEGARARLARIESRARYAGDRIAAEIRGAMAGLEAAYAQTVAARENLDLALRLEAAEERRLMLGSSNLIDVNIRELQAASAGIALIETQAAYFRALADYRAAVARTP